MVTGVSETGVAGSESIVDADELSLASEGVGEPFLRSTGCADVRIDKGRGLSLGNSARREDL